MSSPSNSSITSKTSITQHSFPFLVCSNSPVMPYPCGLRPTSSFYNPFTIQQQAIPTLQPFGNRNSLITNAQCTSQVFERGNKICSHMIYVKKKKERNASQSHLPTFDTIPLNISCQLISALTEIPMSQECWRREITTFSAKLKFQSYFSF